MNPMTSGRDNYLLTGINDCYVWNLGDGSDFVEDITECSWGMNNTLQFGAGIKPQDIHVTADNDNIVLTVNTTSETVSIVGWFKQSNNVLSRIKFTDVETVWTTETLESFLDGNITGTGKELT